MGDNSDNQQRPQCARESGKVQSKIEDILRRCTEKESRIKALEGLAIGHTMECFEEDLAGVSKSISENEAKHAEIIEKLSARVHKLELWRYYLAGGAAAIITVFEYVKDHIKF